MEGCLKPLESRGHRHRGWTGCCAMAIMAQIAFPPLYPGPGLVGQASAQIGGATAADGPFVLEDAEDLDLVADGVMRDWVPDYVKDGGLHAIPLSASGLTLDASQSSIGALHFHVPETARYIDKSFGVPMPAIPGASTLDHPGNIASFAFLSFRACYQPELPSPVFLVILETYPGTNYPKLYWSFTPALSTEFREVSIDLWNPSSIENAQGLPLEALLSQTRFLSFYVFSGRVQPNTTLDLFIDDIRLTGRAPSSAARWRVY